MKLDRNYTRRLVNQCIHSVDIKTPIGTKEPEINVSDHNLIECHISLSTSFQTRLFCMDLARHLQLMRASKGKEGSTTKVHNRISGSAFVLREGGYVGCEGMCAEQKGERERLCVHVGKSVE